MLQLMFLEDLMIEDQEIRDPDREYLSNILNLLYKIFLV